MEKLHLVNRLLVFMIFSFAMSCTSKAQESDQSSRTEALNLVLVQFDKWKNNEASFFDLLADEAVWTVSGNSPVSGTYFNKKDFMEQAVKPILGKLKTPLKPELVSLSTDEKFVWLHFKASAKTVSNGIYENNYIWKMEVKDNKIVSCVAFLDTYALTDLMMKQEISMEKTIEETKEYIGMWVTADGYIRHELLPNNRYDEARGSRKKAYLGSYKVTANHIDYKDDTGFTADGYFKDGILYHGGMIFYKEKN